MSISLRTTRSSGALIKSTTYPHPPNQCVNGTIFFRCRSTNRSVPPSLSVEKIMKPKLRALEKNILKYRALQMVLLLHQVESLKNFVIGSIKSSDRSRAGRQKPKLPNGEKKVAKKAWEILVEEAIITQEESLDIQKIIDIRNQIGHSIHDLVTDISAPWYKSSEDPVYDYFALERFEVYREKISEQMSRKFTLQISLRELTFEEAEKTYKEELARLHKRILRQYAERKRELA